MNTVTENINIDDRMLVRRYCDGDMKAMERLIVKYQDRLFNTILRMCGNRDDAVELTQDAFVKVLESIDKFEGRSSFYTWLFRIAVNLTLNYCKRRIRASAEPLEGGAVGNRSIAASGLRTMLSDGGSPDPARLAMDREMRELVLASLERLDSDQRTIVILRDIEGMSYAEIAETLCIEIGTVKSRLSRARSLLREILEAVLK